MLRSRPVLVLFLAGALVAVVAMLMALLLEPSVWRVGTLLLAMVLLIWVMTLVRRGWRTGE